MAYSRVTYTGDGSARSFSIPFLFLDRTHVTVKVAGVLKTLTTDYVWLTDSTIQFVTAPASPLSIFIERVTPATTRLVDFQDASVLTAPDLDLSANQNFYIGQEAIDRSDNLATVDAFAAGVGFTAGSTTQLTMSAGTDVTANVVTITFDGVVQHSNTWTLATSGIVTFGAAIPVGTLAVQIAYAAPVTAGFGDGSVTTAALNESVFEGLTTTVPTVLDSVPFADQSSSGNKKKATLQTVIDLARASIIPAGCMQAYAGGTPPTGWLWCQGQAVSRTTYATLFSAIGTLWGVGDGSSTFNVPDTRGRAAIGEGSGAGLTHRDLAYLTGTETHTLTTAEMPAHTHTGGTGQAHSNDPEAGAQMKVGNSANTTPTASTGGGAAHNNMQPSFVVKMIISY